MSESKHTPGPWGIAEMFARHGLTINDGAVPIMAGEDRVALVDYKGTARKRYKAESQERDANARLIAAATDMLAALEQAADYIKELDGGDQHSKTGWKSIELLGVWLHARAAIAKATGADLIEGQ